MDISKKEFQEKTRDQNIIIFGRKLKREKFWYKKNLDSLKKVAVTNY
jgi:hypothetical protein